MSPDAGEGGGARPAHDAAVPRPPIPRIDHVAIRVRSLADDLPALTDGLGFVETSRETTPAGGSVAYLRLGAWEFEVFENPEAEPGLDHIALGIDDLDAAVSALAERRVRFLGDEVSGTRKSRAMILDTTTSAGIRMHLCERPGAKEGVDG